MDVMRSYDLRTYNYSYRKYFYETFVCLFLPFFFIFFLIKGKIENFPIMREFYTIFSINEQRVFLFFLLLSSLQLWPLSSIYLYFVSFHPFSYCVGGLEPATEDATPFFFLLISSFPQAEVEEDSCCSSLWHGY